MNEHLSGAAVRTAPLPGQASAGEPLLSVRGLTAGYGAMVVLREVTMEVRRAQIVAMVGSNGAGKTSLLRALSQLIAWRGEISFDGHALAGLTPDEVFALGMVQVPEGRQLFDRMSVEENLLMGAYRRKDKAGIRDSLEHNYQLFPVLAERRRQLAGSMSGGEQQMCAMARALMAAPRLMLVDEMSLGLSPVIVDLLLDVLTEIRRQGVTVLLVEQDVFSALHIADRGYVMEMGHIVREGVAGQLAVDPEVQRAYLGV